MIRSMFFLIFLHSVIFCQVIDIIEDQYDIDLPDPVSVFSPNVDTSPVSFLVQGEDSLYFLDSNFTIIKELPITSDRVSDIILSRNRNYFLLEEVYKKYHDNKSPAPGVRKITLFDYLGNSYYSYEEPIDYDEGYKSEKLIVDQNGFVFELISEESEYLVRDLSGAIIKRADLFDIKSGRSGYIDISFDDQLVIIAKDKQTSQVPSTVDRLYSGEIVFRKLEKKSGLPTINIYSSEGSLLRSKTIDYDVITGMHAIGQNRMLCLVSFFEEHDVIYKSVVYNMELQKEYEIDHWPGFVKSTDEYIYLGYTGTENRSFLAKYDIRDGNKIYDYLVDDSRTVEGFIQRVYDLEEISDPQNITVIFLRESQGYRKYECSLLLLDRSGKEIKKYVMGDVLPIFHKINNKHIPMTFSNNMVNIIRIMP